VVRRGQVAESIACDFLKKKGFEILERNFRWRGGEIDIIAKEGNILVFVEVRSLKRGEPQDPLLSVGPKKLEKIKRTALYYLTKEKFAQCTDCRFDVVGIITGGEEPEILHIKEAF
jgi:putative endonuclease